MMGSDMIPTRNTQINSQIEAALSNIANAISICDSLHFDLAAIHLCEAREIIIRGTGGIQVCN